MTTPFTQHDEKFFPHSALRVLDFVELPDGWIYAFNLRYFNQGLPIDETNSIRCFKRASVLPEAIELLLSAPLLYKSLLAVYEMQKEALDSAQQMQEYLRHKYRVTDANVDFIVKTLTNAQNQVRAACDIPVMGREEAMKQHKARLDIKDN